MLGRKRNKLLLVICNKYNFLQRGLFFDGFVQKITLFKKLYFFILEKFILIKIIAKVRKMRVLR